MDEIVVLARIVLRDPVTLGVGVGLSIVIAAGWLWSVRGRGWGVARRTSAVLGAGALGMALSIVLARQGIQLGRSWYCLGNPGLGWGRAEEALNLVLYAPAAFFAVVATRRVLATTGVFLVLVVLVECIQKVIDAGTCEVGDMTRNACGALLGSLAGAVVLRFTRARTGSGSELPRG